MNKIKGMFIVVGESVLILIALIINIYISRAVDKWNYDESSKKSFLQ